VKGGYSYIGLNHVIKNVDDILSVQEEHV